MFQTVVLWCRWSASLIRLIKFVLLSGRWQQDRMRRPDGELKILSLNICCTPTSTFFILQKTFLLINSFSSNLDVFVFELWRISMILLLNRFCFISYKTANQLKFPLRFVWTFFTLKDVNWLDSRLKCLFDSLTSENIKLILDSLHFKGAVQRFRNYMDVFLWITTSWIKLQWVSPCGRNKSVNSLLFSLCGFLGIWWSLAADHTDEWAVKTL